MLPTITFEDVLAAEHRIASHIHRTPVITCDTIDRLANAKVYFKCEGLQKSGAFKFRGATNALAQLTPDQLQQGVVTHSSGNHAGALARAAQMFGTKAYIVMPSNSSEIKKAAVKSYGGTITQCEPTLVARMEVAAQIQADTGAVLVPPFDHPHVIAGQGTVARELIQQVPQLDAIIAPIGGGGLISGTCISAHAHNSDLLVVGAEPQGADDALQSKRTGTLVPQVSPDTICDGLRTSLGKWTWPFIRDQVEEIISVSDDETIAAMKLFWERTKFIIEPSSAVSLAALLSQKPSLSNCEHIGIILSGSNVDLLDLPWS